MIKRSRILIITITFCVLCVVSGCSEAPPDNDQPASISELDRSRETAINVSLKQNELLAGENIRVVVINAEVTLLGTVDNIHQIKKAEEIASKAQGIKTVNNKLRVR